jgi:IS1 family transposase
LEEVGAACDRLHDKLVRNVVTDSCQIDELWARVAIRQSRTTPQDKERGDFYTFLGLTAREKLIVSHRTGKRDYQTTESFVKDLASRIPGRIQITSDAWRAYPALIRRYLLERLDYAVMVKQYATTPGEVEAKRRYSPAPFTGVTIKVRAGAPRADRICTSFVERQNLSVRHFTKRFGRLGLGWSRKLDNHRAAVSLFVAAHNFCKVHSSLGCTPAVGAGLTDHNWSVEELLKAACESNS